MSEAKSFWTTLPGILSGLAGVITAIGGFLTILYSIGVIGPGPGEVRKERSELGSERVGDGVPQAIQNLEKKIADLDQTIEILERKIAESPHPPGSLQEMKDIRREREKRLEEIDKSETALRVELDQLQRQELGNPHIQRKIEQIVRESIPDLEAERSVVQGQIQDLTDKMLNAEKNSESTGKIEDFRKKKQALQEEVEHLTSQMRSTK